MSSARSIAWLNRFAWLTCIATLFLICSGGMVTSKGVGLVVPDWPTTFGYNMFLFPISKWVGGIFFEHTHRLIASTVGFMTIILAVWLRLGEDRRWVRSLGYLALAAVILQGVLGGLRVTMLKDEIGIFHACLAQAFLALLVIIALVTTKFWQTIEDVDRAKLAPIKSIAVFATVLIYIQLALGATMRHQHRDLAILDFPTAYRQWIPDTSANAMANINAWRDTQALSDVTAFQIWLQMIHRFFAAIIAVAVITLCLRVWRDARPITSLRRLSIWWVVLLLGQVTLGAWTIWSNKAADIATAHVAIGATMLSFGVSICAILGRIFAIATDGKGSIQRMKSVAIERETANAAADFAELVKARLTLLVLLTTAVGFYVGARGPVSYLALFHVVFGTAAAAAGAAALNQWWERKPDALMNRTKTRPVPAGRMRPIEALVVGGALSLFGIVYLAVACNALSAVLAAVTIAIYIFAYTPLKRISNTNTIVGAIPGALPPVIGWAAARGRIDAGAWSLFAILVLWQLPHFFAISWMYRDDYSRAGFRMISGDDRSGERSASQSVFFCIILLIIAGIPAFLQVATWIYLPIELALGGWFIAVAMRFLRLRTASAARTLFITSIIYLPLLLGALVLTKS